MVVSVQDLNCLDVLIWLRTGAAVAARLGLSQATVSRTAQQVCDCFGVAIAKRHGEWEVSGHQELLNRERLLHQAYRWSRDCPLRIEAQYYSGPLYCHPAPQGWMAGNFDYLEIHTPLQHLRRGVIDAWIGCYPDLPAEEDQDLICFDLTRLPTHLVVSGDHPLLALGDAITLEDVRQWPSLALPDQAFPRVQAILQGLGLWNLPMANPRYDPRKWEGKVIEDLVVGYATAFTMDLFAAPQRILPIPIPLEVGDSLIVRRDYATHPRLFELLSALRTHAQQLAQRFPEVRIPAG